MIFLFGSQGLGTNSFSKSYTSPGNPHIAHSY
jgi:hypothetical protein